MDTSTYMGNLERGLGFAGLLCDAYGGAPVYVVHGRTSKDLSVVSLGGWAGVPIEGSNAPFVAHSKAMELVVHGNPVGLSLTPLKGFKMSLGWMGGARLDQDLVGVSGWRQKYDRLLALVLLYAQVYETRLHHVGYRHARKKDAIDAALGLGTPKAVPAKTHLRLYTAQQDGRSPYKMFYREQQWFPDGPHRRAVHWDLVTTDPERLLVFVAQGFDQEPVWLEPTVNGPVGLVEISVPPKASGDEPTMGIMARSTWWQID